MKTRWIYWLACAFLLMVFSTEATARLWTDTKGKSIEAEYIGAGAKEGTILLQRQNGAEITVQLNSLSEADKKFVAAQQKAKPAKAAPVADTLLDDEPGYEGLTIVIADGYGETIAEAKKDALQNAVSEVVGTLVDAETRVVNDELIENILTASGAYVGKHKVLSTKKEDGIYHIQIKAGVVQKSLTMRLSATKSTKKIDGASLAGAVETSVKSENDATLMFAKILKDESFPYSLMDVELSEPRVVKRGETNTLEFDYTCKGNMEKYAIFSKKIMGFLDKTAVKKQSFLVVAKKEVESLKYDPRSLPNVEKDKHYFCVNTNISNNFQSTQWQYYEIPKKFTLPIYAYSKLVPAAEISFYDKQKNLITVKRMVNGYQAMPPFDGFSFFATNFCSHLIGYTGYRYTPGAEDSVSQSGSCFGIIGRGAEYSSRFVFAFAPFNIHNPNTGGRYTDHPDTIVHITQRKVQVTLTKEELARLDHVEVRLLEDCPEMDDFYEKLPKMLKEMDE